MRLTEKEIKILELKKKGLTQIDMAKKLRISQAAVSGFYNNALKKINISHQNIKIAQALKIKIIK